MTLSEAASQAAAAVASAAANGASSATNHPSSSSGAARPSAHTQRYDRQLRLWASSGQASLESARIAVLGASHLGACILKNLVLPGIGAFELVDARTVDAADVGNNFFVSADAIEGGTPGRDNADRAASSPSSTPADACTAPKGKSRAHEVAHNLSELNSQVKAAGVLMEPAEWVQTAALDNYTMVIAVNQPHDVLLPLADKAWAAKAGVGVPLMALTGSGLIGQVDVQVNEAGIIETHPENTIDLRLTRPWAELSSYAKAYDVGTQDSMAHSHIPFVVILLRKLEEWSAQHGGNLPQPSTDRKAFTDTIHAMRRPGNADEENIDEAIAALGQHVWRPVASTSGSAVPSEITTLFDDPACDGVTAKSTNFWILVRALRHFVREGDGTLPQPGSLPDFKALSTTYVEVQRIYRAKARQDLETLRRHLDKILFKIGLPSSAISQDELESFARHAAYIKIVRGKSLRKKLAQPDKDALTMALLDPINPVTAPYHIALLAAEQFYVENDQRYPGCNAALSRNITGQAAIADAADDAEALEAYFGPLEFDQERLIAHANDIITRMGLELDDELHELVSDACLEIARGGHADIPSTTALLGGVAAQEAIKLVTRQYVPMDNTAVYDGIRQAIGVFRL